MEVPDILRLLTGNPQHPVPQTRNFLSTASIVSIVSTGIAHKLHTKPGKATQLERYLNHLSESPISNKRLVLLTRSKSSIQETSLSTNQFHHICWYQIAGWLSDFDFQDVIVLYFVQNFIEFLKEKDMSMEKVTWEYIKGLPAMINLSNMLGTAISELFPEKPLRKTVGANWSGYYLDGNYFIGFRFNDPLVIVIENNNGTNPSFKNDLNLEEVHFFSLSAGDQLELMISFIKNSIEK